MIQLSESELFQAGEPNVAAYKSVVRGVLAVLMKAIAVDSFPPDLFAMVVDIACAIYTEHPSALSCRFLVPHSCRLSFSLASSW